MEARYPRTTRSYHGARAVARQRARSAAAPPRWWQGRPPRWLPGGVSLLLLAATMGISVAEVRPPLVNGETQIDTFVEASLSTRSPLDPVSVAVDAVFRLDAHLEFALSHSASAADKGEVGSGVCLRDEQCRTVYSTPSLVVGYRLGAARWRATPQLGVVTRGMDPWRLAVVGGGRAELVHGDRAIVGTAWYWRGLHLREAGNADRVHLALRYWHQVLGRGTANGAWLSAGLGLRSALDTFPDAVRIPVGVGASYRTKKWDVGLNYELPKLLGALNDYKPRLLYLYFSYRLENVLRQSPAGSSRGG